MSMSSAATSMPTVGGVRDVATRSDGGVRTTPAVRIQHGSGSFQLSVLVQLLRHAGYRACCDRSDNTSTTGAAGGGSTSSLASSNASASTSAYASVRTKSAGPVMTTAGAPDARCTTCAPT